MPIWEMTIKVLESLEEPKCIYSEDLKIEADSWGVAAVIGKRQIIKKNNKFDCKPIAVKNIRLEGEPIKEEPEVAIKYENLTPYAPQKSGRGRKKKVV